MKVSSSAREAVEQFEEDLSRDETRNTDFYVEMERQRNRTAIVNGVWPITGEEITTDEHYDALEALDATGSEWRVYLSRLGYDSRPLTDRIDRLTRGCFGNPRTN